MERIVAFRLISIFLCLFLLQCGKEEKKDPKTIFNFNVGGITGGTNPNQIPLVSTSVNCETNREWKIIAGSITDGFKGDGGDAKNAFFFKPNMIKVDKNGDIYIADMLNHRIRKINASDKKISTVAGGGSVPVSHKFGDGRLAIQASLYKPKDIALSKFGDLFIVDGDNLEQSKFSTIRNVPTVGLQIDTYLGRNHKQKIFDGVHGQDANLDFISRIIIDQNLKTFLALSGDKENGERIVLYDPHTQQLTTVAGTKEAGFSGDGDLAAKARLNKPRGLAFDSSGDLYVSDMDNHRIRKIHLSKHFFNPNITTFAGSGQGDSLELVLRNEAKLNHPKGIAFDDQDNLYIADAQNMKVRKVSAQNGSMCTVADNRIIPSFPMDVAVHNNTIYILFYHGILMGTVRSIIDLEGP